MVEATKGDREVRVASLAGLVGRFDRGTWARIVDARLVPSRGAPTQTVRVADAQRFVDDHDGYAARAFLRHLEMPGDLAVTVRYLADLGVRSADVIVEGALIGYGHDAVDDVCDPRLDKPEMTAALAAIGLRVALAAEHGRRISESAP